MTTLAVIGTAGRSGGLLPSHWEFMIRKTREHIQAIVATRLVSGGAAWSDHVAVELHKEGIPLRIHIPKEGTRAAGTTRYYHEKFARIRGLDPLVTLTEVNNVKDVVYYEGPGSSPFFTSNSVVAKEADYLLAFTMDLPGKVSGGTGDTWKKFLSKGGKYSKRATHVSLLNLKSLTAGWTVEQDHQLAQELVATISAVKGLEASYWFGSTRTHVYVSVENKPSGYLVVHRGEAVPVLNRDKEKIMDIVASVYASCGAPKKA